MLPYVGNYRVVHEGRRKVMEQGIGSVISRKLLTTFVATITFSGLMVYGMIFSYGEFEYNKGNSFLGWFWFIVSM